MKRLILFILLSLQVLILYLPLSKVEAVTYTLTQTEIAAMLLREENVYGRVTAESKYIYSERGCNDKIFEVPATYYVKMIEYADDVCRVLYCFEDYDYARGISGYMQTNSLVFVSTPPTNRSFANIFPKFEGNGNFYKNNKFDSLYSATEMMSGGDAFFYGFYYRGREQFCYVLQGGKFGYYSADVFERITISPHQDPMPIDKVFAPIDSTGGEQSADFFKSDKNKIIFISVTCIVAISIVYAIFLPKKKGETTCDDDCE